MIVGNLPLIDSLNDDDILICSDDGQHTKRIKMSGLRRSGGKGLVYWVEDEHSISRVLVNDGSTEFDERFTVPGKAKMMVEVQRKSDDSIDTILETYQGYESFKQFTREPETNKYVVWLGYGDDPEEWDHWTINHDPDDHIEKFTPLKYYYLERLSNKPVMGGACAFKIWGNTNYESRLPAARVRRTWRDPLDPEVDGDTHDYYVPFWLLMSENPDNLIFQFIEEDVLTQEKQVLQTVEALDLEIPFNGMTFYVNGFVDPELYESHALWNSFSDVWIYLPEPYSSINEEAHIIHQIPPEHYGDYDDGLYTPNPYYTAVKRVSNSLYISYDSTVGSWFYKDDRYAPAVDSSKYLHLKPSKNSLMGSELDFVKQPVSDYNRKQWIRSLYQYSTTNLGNMQVYSVKWGNSNPQHYTDQYEFFGDAFPWLGCVDNITGIGYEEYPGGKDATTYIFHDADITVPYYYYTGIEDGRRVIPGTGRYNDFVFYSGIGEGAYDETQGVPHGTILNSNIKIDRLGYIYAKGLYLDDQPIAGIEGINYRQISGDSTVVADYTVDGTQNYISAPITTYNSIYDSSTGVKVGTISCNGNDYDIYTPSGGGGGSNVNVSNLWVPDTLASKKRAVTLTVNGLDYDIYAPDTTIADMTVTPDYNSGTRLARITTVNSSTGAVTNNDIYLPSSGSTFGCQTGRLTTDSVGNPISTTGGPYTITVDGLKTTSNGSTAFKFAKGLWKFDVRLVWTLKSTEVFSAHGVENIILAVTSKSNAGVWYAGTVFPSDPKTRYFVSPMYAGESNIVIDIPLSCALNVASAQLQTPSFTLQITHDKWSTAYEVSHIDWSVVAYKIGEYN